MLLEDERIDHIAHRLLPSPMIVEDPAALEPAWRPVDFPDKPPVPAAVLIALVKRRETYSLLFTQRSSGLRSHSGQIAFPGGKIDPEDEDIAAAALREAQEEVAMRPEEARVLGYLPYLYTGTNYLITPVVALVEPSRPFVPNPGEVQAIFEIPLNLIARESSYTHRVVEIGTRRGSTWQIEHEGRSIWGITANLTREFRDRTGIGEHQW